MPFTVDDLSPSCISYVFPTTTRLIQYLVNAFHADHLKQWQRMCGISNTRITFIRDFNPNLLALVRFYLEEGKKIRCYGIIVGAVQSTLLMQLSCNNIQRQKRKKARYRKAPRYGENPMPDILE